VDFADFLWMPSQLQFCTGAHQDEVVHNKANLFASAVFRCADSGAKQVHHPIGVGVAVGIGVEWK
jgi:hypothetical protein